MTKGSRKAANISNVTDNRSNDASSIHEEDLKESLTLESLGEAVEMLGGGMEGVSSRLERLERVVSELEKTALEEFGRAKDYTIETDTRIARFEEKTTVAIEKLHRAVEAMLGRLDGVESMKGEFDQVKEDLALCKRAVVQGLTTPVEVNPTRIQYPKPSKFNGVRDAQGVENFLWEMEAFLENLGMTDEPTKIKTATSYLTETAMCWESEPILQIQNSREFPIA